MSDDQSEVEQKIQKISKKYNVYTYFYDYPVSEANNLRGKSNIFLNINQPEKEIWNDFNELIYFICNT